MKRVQLKQTNAALREQSRYLGCRHFVEEKHVGKPLRLGTGLQPASLRPPAHKDEPDIVTLPQMVRKVEEDVHTLGDAHIADIGEDIPILQRRARNLDAASGVDRKSTRLNSSH